ncbi:short chain dehydrogenase/reductase [Lizonia empirigonia]|nr:short chain dehydrogenase/reductase [Lizonia empirigonia]
MPYALQGRNVLITGGSAGLGALLSTTFAREGCHVAINYFNRIEPAREVQRLCQDAGVKVILVKADMTSTAEAKRAVQETVDQLGGIDIVIANAGWTKFCEWKDHDGMTEEEWDKGISQGGSSMPYSITKAAQLHLVKCLAVTEGPKIRVNTVLPGLLLTEWGKKYSPERIEALKNAAVLKRDTGLDDCVDAFVMLAKNSSMTGMRIQVDAGLNVQGA